MSELTPRRLILAQVLVTCGPSIALLGMGRGTAAALWYLGTLLPIVIYSAAGKDAWPAGAITIATIPLLMVIRDYFSYSSAFAVLALGVAVYGFATPQRLLDLFRNRVVFGLLAALSLYWMLSAAITVDVFANIRAVELALAVTSVYLLGQSRKWLAASLNGLILCTLLVSIGLLPFGDRLGAARIGDISLGNPVRTGFLCALALLLAFADRGRWLQLEKARRSILVIVAASSCALALSTSRGGWAVAAAALCAVAVLDRRSRVHLLGSGAVVAIALIVVLQSSRGATVVRYFEKMASSDRTILQRTSGRSDQWLAFPQVVWASPLWGHGLGAGRRISYEYTGVGRPWHSLYLHVGTETGLIGMSILGMLLYRIAVRCRSHRRATGETLPAAALVGFATVGITVIGFDAISGIYVGLALLAGDLRSVYVMTPLLPRTTEEVYGSASPVLPL